MHEPGTAASKVWTRTSYLRRSASHSLPEGITRVRLDAVVLVALVAAGIVAGSLGRAMSKPLWHDEIFTLYLSTRLAPGELWGALAGGVDLNPPLSYLSTRGAWLLTGDERLAVRLPAVAGFLTATFVLFAFTRRRLGVPAATVAAITPALTGAAIYAYEGRPYGLMLGLAALAILAWQSRVEQQWRQVAPIGCALALAAASLTHYYAVLTLLPLAAGELTRTLKARRVDWLMVGSFGGALLPLLFLQPLLAAARQFSSGFWARPDTGMLAQFLQDLLLPISLLTLPVIAAAASVRWVSGTAAPDIVDPREHRDGWRAEEVVLIVALLALPVVGFAVAALVTGAFHGRYVLPAVLGVGLTAGWIVRRVPQTGLERVAAATVILGVFGLQQIGGAFGLVRAPSDPLIADRAALNAATEPIPFVAAPALVYLPIAHYADPDLAARLVYLTKPPAVAAQTNTTSDRALLALAEYVPLRLAGYEDFLARTPEFYLFGRPSWMAPLLIESGADVQLLASFEDRVLYRVRAAR